MTSPPSNISGEQPNSTRRVKARYSAVRPPSFASSQKRESLPTLKISRRQGAVARIVLNRPDIRNAFNDVMIRELREALSLLEVPEGMGTIIRTAGVGRDRLGLGQPLLCSSSRTLSLQHISNRNNGRKPTNFSNFAAFSDDPKNPIRATFGRYLSDEIVTDILERPEGLELGGDLRQVTIMMSDIRGFTTLSGSCFPRMSTERASLSAAVSIRARASERLRVGENPPPCRHHQK